MVLALLIEVFRGLGARVVTMMYAAYVDLALHKVRK